MPDLSPIDQAWEELFYRIDAGHLDSELDSAYVLTPDDYSEFEDAQ